MAVFVQTLHDSLHYDLRQEHGRWLTVGLITALMLHGIPAVFGPPGIERPVPLRPGPIRVLEVPTWIPLQPAGITRPDIPTDAPEIADLFTIRPLLPVDSDLDVFRPPVDPGLVEGAGEVGAGTARFLGPESRSPQVLHRVVASYPELARMAEAEGLVVLLITVGADGLVSGAEVVESDAITILEKAALAAVQQWVFRPAYQGSQPVPVQIRVPFDFRLR